MVACHGNVAREWAASNQGFTECRPMNRTLNGASQGTMLKEQEDDIKKIREFASALPRKEQTILILNVLHHFE